LLIVATLIIFGRVSHQIPLLWMMSYSSSTTSGTFSNILELDANSTFIAPDSGLY